MRKQDIDYLRKRILRVSVILIFLMILCVIGFLLGFEKKVRKEFEKPPDKIDFKKYLIIENENKLFPQGEKINTQGKQSVGEIRKSVECVNFFTPEVERWRGLVSQYDWNVDEALLVISKESGGNPNAVSDTNDYGLFQLHNRPIFDPVENIKIAYYEYYLLRGWVPWYGVKGILW